MNLDHATNKTVVIDYAPSIEEAESAFNLKVSILQHKRDITEKFLSLGEGLHKMREEYKQNKPYTAQLYGFDSFKLLYTAPEESGGLGMSESSVNRFIRLYVMYVLTLNIQPHVIAEIADYSKLDKLAKVINENNAEAWFAQAKVLGRDKLDIVIDQYKRDHPKGDGKVPEGEITTTLNPNYMTARDWHMCWGNLETHIKEKYLQRPSSDLRPVREMGQDVLDIMKTIVDLQ